MRETIFFDEFRIQQFIPCCFIAGIIFDGVLYNLICVRFSLTPGSGFDVALKFFGAQEISFFLEYFFRDLG